MRQFTKNVVKFLKAEDGPTAVEYAVMLALIIVVCIGAVTTLGGNAPQWLTANGLWRAGVAELSAASDHGLEPSDYDVDWLNREFAAMML